MAAAIGMIAGCQKPEMTQIFAPEDILAPVLADFDEDIIITADNLGLGTLDVTWTEADYGANTQINYAVEIAKAGSEDKTVITSGITDAKASISYEALNSTLIDMGITPGEETDVNFYVSSQVGQYVKTYSNAVAAKVACTAAEKKYPSMTVVGSYQGWKPGAGLYVYDFAGDDKVYQGMIDFGTDHASLEFKITGSDWGAANGEHSVPEGTEVEAEATTIPLVNGGGSNISAYRTYRYYHFTFDKTVPSLTMNLSFDQIGVIGDFNSWGGDVVMNYDKNTQKFYADVEFPADGGFKFRLNGKWDVSYGSTGSGVLDSGDNIPVTAGNYRVYLNMNNLSNMTYELNAADYGKAEETPAPEPEEPEKPAPANEGWGIVGTINNWGNDGDPDIDMKVGKGWYVAAGIEIAEGAEIKFRLDGGWDVNFGGTFAADTKIGLVAGGDNFKPAAGTYDIYLNPDLPAAYFMTAGAAAPAAPETWGIVGTTNNWGGDDIDMGLALDAEGKYWVRKGVALPNGEIKIRWANDWSKDFGGTFAANAAITAEPGGSNFKCVEGTYDIYLDTEANQVFFMTDGKTPADAGEAEVTYIDASAIVVGLSGKFAGTDAWGDPEGNRLASFESKTLTDESTYAGTYVYKIEGFEISNGDLFKVRINGGWIGGASIVEGLEVDGDDNIAANEGGTFNIKITFDWNGLEHSNVKAVFSK